MPSTITPAEKWRAAAAAREEGELVTLPSGDVVRLRKEVSAYELLRSGRITQAELAAIEQASRGDLQDPALAVRVIDLLCEVMFLEPRVVTDREPGDDEIKAAWLPEGDQTFVLERAFGGTPSEAFPGERDGAGRGDDGPVLADAPKRAARPAKRKPARSRGR